ncbi:MAG: hypothetical protein AAB268_06510 [Elusimicrobiota bacterium]
MRTVLALVLLAFPAAARRADPIADSFKRIDQIVEKGEYAKARDALADVLAELKPEDPRLVRYHERTGAVWLREGKIPEARFSFILALKAAQRLKVNDDSVAKAYAGMGLCLRRGNNDGYALRFFKKALASPLDDGTRMFVEDQIREIEGAPPVPAR